MDLIINTPATSIKAENDCFVIESKGEPQIFSPLDINCISIQRGICITSDAMILAINNEIPIFIMTNRGFPIGRISSPKYGSISTIRKGQFNFCQSEQAVEWVKEMQCKKIENQQAILLLLAGKHEDEKTKRSTDKAIDRLNDYRKKIHEFAPSSMKEAAPTLRGWEGSASKIYFEEINKHLPEHLQFSTRSQHPATDVANAFLNYGYGMLYGKIEAALVKAGIDPYAGIFHRDDYNKPVLVYDVIEQYRVWVDYVVITLLNQLDIDESFYTIKSDGTCILEQLGRKVVILAMTEYLEEITENNSVMRSRNTQIQLYANELAQKFIQFKT